MRRNRGRHAHRNTFGAVDQNIRHLHRKHLGFLLGLVEIRNKIHNILVQIRQIRLLRDLLQTCFGVSHRRGPVPFDGTEIAVAVDQRQSLLKILGHDHQGIIDRAVTVGMIFPHRITHDTSTFAVGPVITDPQLVHVVERPALHRL